MRGVRQRLKGFQPAHLIAAFVDPRSKYLPMFDDETKSAIRVMVKEEMVVCAPTVATKNIQVNTQPKSRKAAIFNSDENSTGYFTSDDERDQELNQYMATSRIPYFYVNKDGSESMHNPLDWWRTHANDFPTLAILAKKYLCIPATSAPVERLFSHAGLTITAKRNRLAEDVAAELIFLNANWEKLHFGEEDVKGDVVEWDSDIEIVEATA